MTAIMPIDEPRPRGPVLGERADKRRVHEVGHYFRCKTCNGWIDARDYPNNRTSSFPIAIPVASRSW
jgi:hypothetical protein